MFKKMDNLVLANVGVSLAVLGLVIYLVVKATGVAESFTNGGGPGNRQGRRLVRQLGRGGSGSRNRIGRGLGGGRAARGTSRGVHSGSNKGIEVWCFCLLKIIGSETIKRN